jgi:protein O-GlcNAc transferase
VTIPNAYNLAVHHHQAGRLDDAEALYRQILSVQPNHAGALHFLGLIAHQAGRHDSALELISKAILLDPNNADAYSNLGMVYRALGRLDEAITHYHRALQLKSDTPEIYNNLAIALKATGRIDEAIAAYRHALQLKPDSAEAHNNLAIALMKGRLLDEAAAESRRALALKPVYAEAHNSLGNALRELGQLSESIASYRRALELKPGYLEAHNNLANAFKDQGKLDEAIAAYRRALKINPGQAWVHSNLIYTLHFHPGHNRRTIAEEQQRWNRQFGDPLKPCLRPHANNPATAGRLRVGYVSPDFRYHPVGRYMLPLFRGHDHRNFEIFSYSGVAQPDPMTEEIRRHTHQWRNTVGVGDEALAEQIRNDGVDILVDLTQHMADNRLLLFARKPAPVQVSFAGYPETTGLEAIRHRISDRYLEDSSADEGAAGREHVHFIDSFWCHDSDGAQVEVNSLPAFENGFVTFGCLNNFCKVNESVLSVWARVLGQMTDSRLLIYSPGGSHRRDALEALEEKGVAAGRVEFVDFRPWREYLELHHRFDIFLDTFPYNGGVTTCDALWMGIPVVSLAGETSVSRMGLSLLTNLGHSELVARSESEYVKVATELAADLGRLSTLRATLRRRMEGSVLMDAPRFVRQVEQAYRSMWKYWRLSGS